MYTPQKTESGHLDKKECPSFSGSFRLTPDKRVRVVFLKQNLSHDVIKRYFRNGYFEMEKDFELPAMISLQIGIESCIIHSGHYPIHEDKHFFWINF